MTDQKFNKDDPQLLQLARALADIGPNDFPTVVVDYGKNVMKNGPTSIPETIEYFESQGYHSLAVAGAINGLRNFGIVEEVEGDRFQFSKEMLDLIHEIHPKAKKENEMSKNQKLDTNDETNRHLANAIATGVDADKDLESFFCRALFLMGPKKLDEMKFMFEDDRQYKGDMDDLENRIDDLRRRGVLQYMDDEGRVTLTQDMITMVLTINPGAVTDDDREENRRQNNAGSGNDKQATDKQDDAKKQNGHARSMQAEVDKIRTDENLDLAKRLAAPKNDKADDEVRLVRAVYDDAAEGVNFDTVSNKFDTSTTRAQLFMSLSKQLRQRGVLEKLEQENGDLYVVTMPFRSLMDEAVHKAKNEGRFENGGADVANAPHVTLKDQSRQGQKEDDNNPDRQYSDRDLVGDDDHAVEGRNEPPFHRRGFQSSTPQASRSMMTTGRGSESGGDQARGSMQRSVDLPGGKGRGRTDENRQDNNRQQEKREIQPDVAVMTVTIMVYGVPVQLDDVLKLYKASINLLDMADGNPEVEPTFTAYGIQFNVDRAHAFLDHVHHYGIVR